jgi:hypothetical protein
MVLDPIDSAYTQISTTHIIPSFFQWLFGGALSLGNGGLFGIGLQLIVALVSLLVFKPFGIDRGMVTSGIITVTISALLLKAGWINNFMFVLSIIYFGFGLYGLYSTRSQEEA